MFAIGEFARHGRVSVRMLRHYDASPSVQALARWIDGNGYRSLGYARELTLEFGANEDQWVTELQEPITA